MTPSRSSSTTREARVAIGDLSIRFIRGRHYVPAWGVVIDATGRDRLVFSGDTGPNDTLVDAARGADLLLVEATLRAPRGRSERGHLTATRRIDMGERAGARSTVLVHYAPDREPSSRRCARPPGPGSARPSPARP